MTVLAERMWRGFRLPVDAAMLLWQTRGIKRYAMLPLFLNLILYAVALSYFFNFLGHWEWQTPQWSFWGGEWLSRLIGSLGWMVKWIVMVPLALAVAYFSFTTVGLLVASLFTDLLAERVDLALGRPLPPTRSWAECFRQAFVAARDALWIVVQQLAAIILTLPFLLIPVVGVIPLFLVNAWFSGRGFWEACMVRRGVESATLAAKRKAYRKEILGLGVAMGLLCLIPGLGLLALPVGVTAGVLAADLDSVPAHS